MPDNSTLAARKAAASAWFENARDQLCRALEACEKDCAGPNGSDSIVPGQFKRTAWHRGVNADQAESGDDDRARGGSDGGGGVMAVMRGGRVFEKAGVNVSTVWGVFSEEFRARIPGADKDPRFWASGLSVVIHPRNPRVPISHMNTRMIVTSRAWFGGGGDLTPVFPNDEDTATFHGAYRMACDAHNPDYYPKFSKWCDEYFYLPHRGETRGVGGIFYDNLDSGDWEADFAFTRDVGSAFSKAYLPIVRANFDHPWTDEQRQAQRIKRSRYVEFNLLHDRGTLFGLKTGGNTDAILMSLPPDAAWP